MRRTKEDNESAMQRFENLASHLFSIAKDDIDKVEEVAKEAVDEILSPPPSPATEDD